MLEAAHHDPAIGYSIVRRSTRRFGVSGRLPYHRVVRLPRVSPRAYRRITLLALCAQVFIMVTGAAVRLTGSGLGCSDWPKCEEDQLVAPLEYHAMIEFLNRTITGLVSVAVIAAVLGSLLRSPRRSDLTWWSLGLVAGVIGQIVLGGLTVLFELHPPFVIAHFLVSIVLVWNSYVLHVRAGHAPGPALPAVAPVVRRLGRALVALAGLALITGTIVTGTGPHGGDETVERLPLDLESVVRVHSITVWTFLAVAIVAVGVLNRRGAPRDVDLRAKVLVAAILVQGAIGYTQFFTGVPPALVLVHVFGSILVWIAVLSFDLSLTVRPLERDDRPAEARPEKVPTS